jgi:hypothetical protein
MKALFPASLLLAALVALGAAPAHGGELIERVVATVNNHVILQSGWDDASCYEALVNGIPLDRVTLTERKATLDRLIDRELLRQQMQDLAFPHATPEEVKQRVAELRKQSSGTASEEGWRALLARYGFTEADFEQHVTEQLDTLHFLDLRLRPNVRVDASSVEEYYRDKLLPELQKSGAAKVPLVEVSPKIQELLAQQKMDELLTAWLHNLRAQSDIHLDTPAVRADASLETR